MLWTWQYTSTRTSDDGEASEDSVVVAPISNEESTWGASEQSEDGASAPDSFPSQSDAESWLGLNWRRLAAEGVPSVDLLNGDRLIYTLALDA